MKRWYNCWLVHQWMAWSEPEEGSIRYPGCDPIPTTVQERRCNICNKRELRRAA